MEDLVRLHNYMGFPVQVLTEEPGRVIEIPPEKPPFVITEIKEIRTIIAIDTNDEHNLHVAIKRNCVSLKSPEGFPGPHENVLYLVPQIIVEAVRKTNRSTTRDLIVPKQENGIGPYRLHYANIITELSAEDPDTENAMYKTWRNSVSVTIAKNMYPHEYYSSDR